MDSEESTDIFELVALTRLNSEVAELNLACQGGVKAEILDELVDVQFFIDRVAALYGITEHARTTYAIVKGHLRETVGKNKAVELQIAESFLNLTSNGD